MIVALPFTMTSFYSRKRKIWRSNERNPLMLQKVTAMNEWFSASMATCPFGDNSCAATDLRPDSKVALSFALALAVVSILLESFSPNGFVSFVTTTMFLLGQL
jgi:hypothetical protein